MEKRGTTGLPASLKIFKKRQQLCCGRRRTGCSALARRAPAGGLMQFRAADSMHGVMDMLYLRVSMLSTNLHGQSAALRRAAGSRPERQDRGRGHLTATPSPHRMAINSSTSTNRWSGRHGKHSGGVGEGEGTRGSCPFLGCSSPETV